MGRLALTGGLGFEALEPWADAEQLEVTTVRGTVGLLDAGDHLVLPRHGIQSYVPAQLVDHPRNLASLLELGCDRVFAICSVGSLHPEIGVGALLCPDDFIALGKVDAAFDDERGHVVPVLDSDWRERVLGAWSAADSSIRDRGIYWQSPGPRFETAAEVRLIAAHADVVGMTMGSECVAATQLGLAYAAVCVVDNFANGIASAPLTREEYESGSAANRQRLGSILESVLPALLAEPR